MTLGPVENVQAVADGSSVINVTWDQFFNNDSPPVAADGYEVEVDGGAPIDVGDVLEYQDTGIDPNTTKQYRVRGYFLPPWDVTSIDPTTGDPDGVEAFTITGTSFRTADAATVTFGATPATGVTVVNSTTITGTTPAGTGTVDVTVTQGADEATLVGGFEYTAAVTPDTFNPADKPAAITLTNGNLTAEDGSAAGFVRSVTGRTAGKYYFEMSWVSAPSGTATAGCGLAKSTLSNTTSGYATADAWMFWGRNAGVRHNSSTVISLATGASENIGFAADLDNNKLWIRRNGTWLQGDPATDTDPIFTNLNGTLHPTGVPWDGGVKVTFRSAVADLVYAVPSGFTAGWPE